MNKLLSLGLILSLSTNIYCVYPPIGDFSRSFPGKDHEIAKKRKKINFDEEEQAEPEQTSSWFSWNKIPRKKYIPKKLHSLQQSLKKVSALLEPDMFEKYVVSKDLDKFNIHTDSHEFLWYVYNLRFHYDSSWSFKLDVLNSDSYLLKLCKEAEINNLSAFSAAIIAPDVTTQDKRNLIGKLYALGFKPTEKDRDCARLELWERTDNADTEKVNLILAGYFKNPESIFSYLPLDVLKLIVKNIFTEKSLLDN